MKAYIALNALLLAALASGSALGPRQAASPSVPAGAGPKCSNAAGQNPGNLAGAGTGNQFDTGCCLSNADCTSQCCGKNTGVCQALGAANNPGIGGCGGTFGSGAAGAPAPSATTTAAAAASTAAGAATTGSATIPAGAGPKCSSVAGQNAQGLAGQGQGNQFDTGCCLSDADCTSGCCGKNTGVCQALGAANNPGIGGCGGTFGTQRLFF